MKSECILEKLHYVVAQTEKISGKNLSLPVLSCVLIQAEKNNLILRATNLNTGIEMVIPAKNEQEGIVAVQSGIFATLLNSFSQEEKITLATHENSLLLQTKRTKVSLKCFAHEDFPTLPVISDTDSFEVTASLLIDGFRSVAFSASLSDIKPEISSVYMYSQGKQLIFVATDAFRLAEKKITLDQEIDIPPLIIPLKNVQDIIRIFQDEKSKIRISVEDHQIALRTENVYFTSRVIAGNFPDYKRIIPQHHTNQTILLKSDMVQILKLVNIFSDTFHHLLVSFNPEKKQATFSSAHNDIGTHETHAEAVIEGARAEFAINHKYLNDVLQVIQSDSIVFEISEPNKPVVIKGIGISDFLYLIMPINKTSQS